MKRLFLSILIIIFFSNCANVYDDKKESLTEALDLSNGSWLLALDDKPDYAKIDYSTNGWAEIDIPSNIHKIDSSHRGSFWIRKNFDINANAVTTNLSLNLGKIYDRDEVYLNGKLIGINGKRPDDLVQADYAYNRIRAYPIPHNALISGKNTLAIRITSNFSNYSGIISGEVGISSMESATDFIFYEATIDLIFVSVFIFIGIFFLINYIKMPEMKEYLMFSLFIIVFSGFDFCKNEFRFLISNKFLLFKYFEYVFLFNIPCVYLLFFQSFFKIPPYPKQNYYFIFNLLFLVVFAIFRDPALWSQVTTFWVWQIPFILAHSGYLCYKKVSEKNIDSYFYMAALLYFIYSVIKEVLIEKGLVNGDSSVDTALFIYILTVTLLLRFRFLRLKQNLQKRFEQLSEIDRLREKLFQYMNQILMNPIESSLQNIRSLKADIHSYKKETVQIISANYNEIDASVDDILELSRLEVKFDSPLKDTVNFVDFIKTIIPEGEITYTIKVDTQFQIHNTLDLVNSLIIRIIDFSGFKNFTNKDLIVTSDLKNHLHFRFMFYNKEQRITQNLFKQLYDGTIRNIQSIRWAIIKEILRLLEGKIEMGIINKKYLRIDFELQALPLEVSTVEDIQKPKFELNLKKVFSNIKLPSFPTFKK